ncbi:serine carboxypeptidase-like 2 [Impatiens glandulifera]|uniref:serine carboxypeptidase-like 2 n=1 Tax=Impatiens glandulifera TaxID=253017 RepID=UPI001FB04C84|nr:serine carboxypeptidase-like 2 [Impatiens glandulifera]
MYWFFFFLLLLVAAPGSVAGGELVRRLPGFDGDLPFKLETGYISVDEVEMFYYFVESEGNPNKDSLFLWLTGGPGCSAFSGLIYEAGFGGGLPKLKYYPYGRTKISSMIFLDAPVGTGFTYSTTTKGNENGRHSFPIDLKGYLVGSPLTDWFIDLNSRVPMAHRMGIITDELYEVPKYTYLIK